MVRIRVVRLSELQRRTAIEKPKVDEVTTFKIERWMGIGELVCTARGPLTYTLAGLLGVSDEDMDKLRNYREGSTVVIRIPFLIKNLEGLEKNLESFRKRGKKVEATFAPEVTEGREFLERIRNQQLVELPELETKYAFLLPHQKYGVRYLSTIGRALVADKPGTGKTIQSIVTCLINSYRRVLILAPARLLENWQENVQRLQHFNPEVKFFYLSYEKLEEFPSSYFDRYAVKKLFNVDYFDCLIADEAHCLKDYRSTRHLNLVTYIHAGCKHLLTGTPIVNSHQDLLTLLALIQWSSFGNLSRWEYNARTVLSLKEDMDPYILCRDTPYHLDVSRERICVKLDDEHYRFYRTVASKNDFGWTASLAAVVPTLDLENLSDERVLQLTKKSAKLRVLLRRLLCISEDEKVIVYTRSVSIAKLLQKVLSLHGFETSLATGELSLEERSQVIENFRERSRILVATSNAMGEGFNLQFANHIIFVDYGWTSKEVEQCIGRVKRVGQTRTIYVVFLIAEDTQDTKRLFMHSYKDAIANSLIP